MSGSITRPTSDRVREAIFSRLESRYTLAGARILDLYAGTGALGIEALSRGAASLVCVERNRRASAVLSENLSACGALDAAELRVQEVPGALKQMSDGGACFDGVFIDPPYGKGLAATTLASVDALGLVADTGWVIAETSRAEELPREVGGLSKVREDVYRDTKVTLYECCRSGG